MLHVRKPCERRHPQSSQCEKVSASHSKGEATIISEDPISEGELEKALDGSGYKILSVSSKPYEKKKLFSFGKK